jgi:hypothetical protein
MNKIHLLDETNRTQLDLGVKYLSDKFIIQDFSINI